ncbi:MAG: TIGR00159 family protein [Planctomycetes bacterium]|nr:TIGR00159 family protein [Planctomycetota bacterium]
MSRISASMLIEIAIFAIGIYAVLRFLRRTRGSGVIRGLSIVLLVLIVSFQLLIQAMNLERLGLVFQSLRDIAVVGLIIVFQPEIRRGIVHLGESPIFSRFRRREAKVANRLLRAVARLSKERIGALMAIERESSLQSVCDTGVKIDAEVNSYLIESIFHRGTTLHDGALIVRGDRLVAASCLLPLSQSQNLDRRLGTRHRAALGLAEETDALVIVVSEETGKSSIALNGRLRHGVSMEELEHTIETALGLDADE